MLDQNQTAKLGVVCCVSLLVLGVAAVVMASCASPATDAPQRISPSPPDSTPTGKGPDAVATPTSLASATLPVQEETAALLGIWADDTDFVLEVGGNGVYTCTYGRGQPDTGTWSLQEDGSLVLEGQSYVAVPHGNLLLLDQVDATFTLRILQKVDDDGNLLAYEPASAIEVPSIDSSAILTITIADDWTGLSPLAPIEAYFRLEPTTDYFSGTAEFSVAGYTDGITRSVPISVPLAVIDELLALLESTPLEVGGYKPFSSHTDDYPNITIAVEGKTGDLGFASESQGSRHIPWRVRVNHGSYVTYADTPAQALDLLDPYLAREVQEELFDLAQARDLWANPMMPDGYLEEALDWEYYDTTVTVDGSHLSDADDMRFLKSMVAFEEATGIKVNYIGDQEFEARLSVAVEAGNPPDIVDFPQPGRAEYYARQGYIIDPTTWISEDWLQQQYKQSWLDMAMVDDGDGNEMMAGVWHRFDAKSLVWYSKKAWDAVGYEIPQTWKELLALTQQIADDGHTAWCIGIESGAATGWPATDWTEEMMLRTTSLENYDAWVKGELKFDSPEVRKAIEAWSEVWFNPDYVHGGTDGIASTFFGDAPTPMFEDPPKCWMHRQGNSIIGFFPERARAGVDHDFFYFPPVDEAYGRPFLVAGHLMSMFNDRPEVRAVMEYLTTPQSAFGWLLDGGALAAHQTATPARYGVDLERRIAKLVLEATSFRIDGSDLMPGEVGAGSFPTGMTDYVSGAADLDAVLKEIDASWPRGNAYHSEYRTVHIRRAPGYEHCVFEGEVISGTLTVSEGGAVYAGTIAALGNQETDVCLDWDPCMVEKAFGPIAVGQPQLDELHSLILGVPTAVCDRFPADAPCGDPCVILVIAVDGISASTACCGTLSKDFSNAFGAVADFLDRLAVE